METTYKFLIHIKKKKQIIDLSLVGQHYGQEKMPASQQKGNLSHLDGAVKRFYIAGLAKATHKTYRCAERRYLSFCSKFSVKPFPATETSLCYYAACLGQEGLTHSTIKTYLSGVRQLQISHGFPDPKVQSMPQLQQIIKGVHVELGKAGRTPRPRLPISPAILKRIEAVWQNEGVSWKTAMLWAASTLAFFGFCRSGEITVPSEKEFDPSAHLTFSDVLVDKEKAPSMIFVKLKKTKTDPYRVGVTITIGATGDSLCPVAAMLFYLKRRGSREGPLFQWPDGIPLTRDRFVVEVRAALDRANLPAKDFAGHSFRIGAATMAATNGLEDSLIQTLGRWKSTAFLLYIKLDPRQLARISSVLST